MGWVLGCCSAISLAASAEERSEGSGPAIASDVLIVRMGVETAAALGVFVPCKFGRSVLPGNRNWKSCSREVMCCRGSLFVF